MNMIDRGGVDDTGEQDVRGLRREFAGDVPLPGDALEYPSIRYREDVPHEGALPDLYRQSDDVEPTDDEITEELLHMVDTGELAFGWIEDRQEFGFWEPSPGPARASSVTPRSPSAQLARASARPDLMSRCCRTLAIVVAAVLAPFAVGLAAAATEHQNDDDSVDQPEMTGNDAPMGSVSTPTATSSPGTAPTPTRSAVVKLPGSSPSLGKHAKASSGPETHKAKTSVGKHRKTSSEEPKKGVKTFVPISKVALAAPAQPETSKGLVGDTAGRVLQPVGSLLGNAS
ncbi:hypothetical protein [Streptomyces sp. NPDC002088]|uniref:hypothetical protein n=1 Tax=Streptomyces sp. NPDC002088 TaxID=3154665 RepID=UPI00332DB389